MHILQMEPSDVQLMSSSGAVTSMLSAVMQQSPQFDELLRFRQHHETPELSCYALDWPTVRLAARARMLPAGYTSMPAPETIEAIYDLNTKSGFRGLANSLGLRIADGEACAGVDSLRRTVTRLVRHHGRVMIKLDRSSNAYGHCAVSADDGADGLEKKIGELLQAHPEQPRRFVVEQFLIAAASPSIELNVTDHGVDTYYFCFQRFANQLFSGMVADDGGISPSLRRQMITAGELIGASLRDHGYRGIFDLDAMVTEKGEVFFSETNVRRTAGTFAHELVSRLVGPQGMANRIWIADSAPVVSDCRLDHGLAAIRASGLDYDRHTRKGVLLTSDSIRRGGKWRYLIVAEAQAEGNDIEAVLRDTLNLNQTGTADCGTRRAM